MLRIFSILRGKEYGANEYTKTQKGVTTSDFLIQDILQQNHINK